MVDALIDLVAQSNYRPVLGTRCGVLSANCSLIFVLLSIAFLAYVDIKKLLSH